MSHDLTGPQWPAPRAVSPLAARVVVPGSKSATARALVLAGIASGPGTVSGGLEARDSALMRGALRALGAEIDDADPATWSVRPVATPTAASIDCGLSGTVARFVPPIAALGGGTTSFHGDPEASARPVTPLLGALAQAGATIEGDRLPFTVTGPVRGGVVELDASGSSQFVSGLLLTAARFPEGMTVRHDGPPIPSRPYLDLTVGLLRARGVAVAQPDENTWVVEPGLVAPADETVPPDLMNAAAFLSAALVAGGSVTVPGWPEVEVPGTEVPEILARFGAQAAYGPEGLTISHTGDRWRGIEINLHATSEVTPVVAVLAALGEGESRITGVEHIRGHETDRLHALAEEINGLGGDVSELPDGLVIRPRPLRAGVWHCYADHRLAHAGALLGLAVDGVVLDDVGCTSKTMPTFPEVWQGMVESTA